MKPRIRTIKPEFWADERICALSRDARVLLLGFVTMADDEGRFRARRSQILGHVFPDDDDAPSLVDRWIGEIREQGIILFYVTDSVPYGAFRHWRRHQKINRASGSLLPPPPSSKVVRENIVPPQGGLTEDSVNAHGELSDGSSLPRTRAFRSDPFVVVDELQNSPEVTADRRIELLCELLGARIVVNDQRAKPSVFSDRWLTDMRRLLADRNDDWQEVQRVIDWCQADEFWRGNILSPSKLRSKFTQLGIKSATPTKHADNPISELDQKRLAAINRLVTQGDAA